MNPEEHQPGNRFISILLTEMLAVLSIFLILFLTKTFFPKTYQSAKSFYEREICAETDYSQVFS